MPDAPAAVLPNGNILFVAGTGDSQPPAHVFEFTSATSSSPNTINQVADPVIFPGQLGASNYNFLVLPTGQIFETDSSNAPEIYTPVGSANPSWAPTVSSAPSAVVTGSASYTLSGTQLNGLTQGAYYGDDAQDSTNYPIVRITNSASGHVFYGRTFNHSTMSVAPGTTGSTHFTVPVTAETGASNLVVIANGIASHSVPLAVERSSYAFPPDFDGDGKSDILWRNTNGDVVSWFMNSGTIASTADLGTIPLSWTIAGTGDFDGKGKSDILWRNSNGDVNLWLMNGGAIGCLGAHVPPRSLSFKHTVQLWGEWVVRGLSGAADDSLSLLFRLIGQLRVNNRPGRIEPRARKRRPKPYPWLKIPREQARANIMAHGHA